MAEIARIAVKSAPHAARRNSRQQAPVAGQHPATANIPPAGPPAGQVAARPSSFPQPASRGLPVNAPAQRAPQIYRPPQQNAPGQPTAPGSSAANPATRRTPGRASLFRPENFNAQPVRALPKNNGAARPPENGRNDHQIPDGGAHVPGQAVTPSTSEAQPQEEAHPKASYTPKPVHSAADRQDAARLEVERPSTIFEEPPATQPFRTDPLSSNAMRQGLTHTDIGPANQDPARSGEKIAQPGPTFHSARPAIERLLEAQPGLPDQTVLLGVCEDGLPVLLDMHDPTPGAVLVMGDERKSQLEMLRAAITSLVIRNTPRNVQFLILSCDPQDWTAWISEQGFQRYNIAIENADEAIIRNWVLRLADWTEQRRMSEHALPAILVVMDTLSFLPRLEYDIRLNFEWMAKEGPQAMIWPFATVSTELAKALSGRRLLRAFKTRILGRAEDPADYVPLVNLDENLVGEFEQPGQFMVRAGENWLKFRLPDR